MADRRLRELEQQWRATGDPAVELSYIRARIREGTLPRPRLLLAAYLGSPGALQVLGDKGFAEEKNLLTWVRGLGKGRVGRNKELAKESAVRAALAAVAFVQERVGSSAELEALEKFGVDWLDCPCIPHMIAVPEGYDDSELAEGMANVLYGDPELSARFASHVVDEAAKRLRGVVRHQRKALRRALYAALISWALESE